MCSKSRHNQQVFFQFQGRDLERIVYMIMSHVCGQGLEFKGSNELAWDSVKAQSSEKVRNVVWLYNPVYPMSTSFAGQRKVANRLPYDL